MDKYEYSIKLDQMKSLVADHDYKTAAEIADSINWHKIKNANTLMKAGEIYERVGRLEDSQALLQMAYDRSPNGRMIVYQLAEVCAKQQKFESANDYYEEFVEIAPHDNLKYILKYDILRMQGADNRERITVLEELKEQEYSEEWAYELAYLYSQEGMTAQCVESCDELILWFGDGPYVEQALELKMQYQPLNRQQEEKYRKILQQHALHPQKVKEQIQEKQLEEYKQEESREDDSMILEDETQAELMEPGEAEGEEMQADEEVLQTTPEEPVSQENMVEPLPTNRFDTINIQEEIQRGIDRIVHATERETVTDAIGDIKKIVEDIPYMQLNNETVEENTEAHIETDEEIDQSLKNNFKEMLAEDYDGQISLYVPNHGQQEPQVSGQMSIEDVLAEWEKTKHAAEVALKEAEQRKLESAKARALQETEDIMQQLAGVIPQLNAEYGMASAGAEEMNGQRVATMNTILQKEIERLNSENAQIDEKLAQAGLPNEEEVQGEESEAEVLDNQTQMMEDLTDGETSIEEDELAEGDSIEDASLIDEGTWDLPDDTMERLTEEAAAMSDITEEELEEPPVSVDRMADENEQMREETQKTVSITRLSDEQKKIFTYFVQINGMKQQLCTALTGTINHLTNDKNAAVGNVIIEGGKGSGKTVLAASLIKALQKECGMPTGRIGKIEASTFNKRDVAALLKKVAGGCLIIEKAGDISREMAVRLALLLKSDQSGLLVIIEDTRRGIEKALAQDEGFAKAFSARLTIPIFTSDELVSFAKAYANELGYTIDEMGVLALYNSISNIQKLDQPTTLTEVKDIVDDAIYKVEKGGLKKAISIITARRYDEEDYVVLHEKDFRF